MYAGRPGLRMRLKQISRSKGAAVTEGVLSVLCDKEVKEGRWWVGGQRGKELTGTHRKENSSTKHTDVLPCTRQLKKKAQTGIFKASKNICVSLTRIM